MSQAYSLAHELSAKVSTSDRNSSTEEYLQISEDLSRILLITAYPNEGVREIVTPEFNISAAVVT